MKQCLQCRAHAKRGSISRYKKVREALHHYYGWHCECCGETELAFLAIDHTDSAPKRKDNPDQKNFTEWLFRNEFPEGFRVLCHNCNMGIRYGRECPHKRDLNRLVEKIIPPPAEEIPINLRKRIYSKPPGKLAKNTLHYKGKDYTPLELANLFRALKQKRT